MSDYWKFLDKYRTELPVPKYDYSPKPELVIPEPIVTEKAFVIEAKEKIYITGLASSDIETAASGSPYMKIRGRYVGAEKANLNNAFWSTGDLEFGQPSVVGGPVNLLHQANQIVGCITEAKLISDDVNLGPHLVTESTLWSFLYPQVANNIAKESAAKNLFYSMECTAEKVQCVDGCGGEFDYIPFMRDRSSACSHLASGGVRRLVNPTFLGVGLIFGKASPGWADATAEVVKEAAQLAEESELIHGIMTKEDAENLVMSVLQWANSR